MPRRTYCLQAAGAEKGCRTSIKLQLQPFIPLRTRVGRIQQHTLPTAGTALTPTGWLLVLWHSLPQRKLNLAEAMKVGQGNRAL
jgi:hypothetical protein